MPLLCGRLACSRPAWLCCIASISAPLFFAAPRPAGGARRDQTSNPHGQGTQ